MSDQIRTCVESLIHAPLCCTEGCRVEAEWAALDSGLTEHARCDDHLDDGGDVLAAKRLKWAGAWRRA